MAGRVPARFGAVPTALTSVASRLRRSALGDTAAVALSTRLTGLAAEAAFWVVFAVPWLILAMVSGLSKVQDRVGVDAVTSLRGAALDLADEVLTPEAIDNLLVPLLDEILVQGRASLTVLGTIAALWAGSRLIHALVEGMTIVYQREGLRGFVATRLVSLGMYVAGVAGLVVVIPLVVAGPALLVRVVPGAQGLASTVLLVGLEAGLVLVLVVSLYHFAVPHRTPWRADLPGGLLALALWGLLSFALRWYFAWLFREGSVYGAISAPIAVMLWAYATCLALLIGAAFNGAIAVRRGWFVRPEAEPDAEPATEPSTGS
jgi:membrane protein